VEGVCQVAVESLVRLCGRIRSPCRHDNILTCLLTYVRAGDSWCELLLAAGLVARTQACLEMVSCCVNLTDRQLLVISYYLEYVYFNAKHVVKSVFYNFKMPFK